MLLLFLFLVPESIKSLKADNKGPLGLKRAQRRGGRSGGSEMEISLRIGEELLLPRVQQHPGRHPEVLAKVEMAAPTKHA